MIKSFDLPERRAARFGLGLNDSKNFQETRARLAWARNPTGREMNLGEVVSRFQFNYDASWQTWVFSEESSAPTKCTSLQNYVVGRVDCRTLLPFICEKSEWMEIKRLICEFLCLEMIKLSVII